MTANLRLLLSLLGAGALAQGLSAVLPPYFAILFLMVGINALLAVSLNCVNGLSGQFSLGHAGFMAVGAYVSASLDVFWLAPAGLGEQAVLVLSTVGGALAAALVGLLVGLPTLRLRGDYLAIATLGAGEIVRVVILNIEAVGGARGFVGVPKSANAFWVYLALGAAVVAIHRFVLSSPGRALLSVREDEIAASCLGVDTTRFKVLAFVGAAALAGVAGGLYAHAFYIEPSVFNFMRSVEVVIMVVLGGMGSVSGSLVAALLLTLLPEALRPLQEWTGVDLRMVVYSALLILMMLLRPGGLFGRRELWTLPWRSWLTRSKKGAP
jgi:branched-chain amino acid transport system permease protein